MMNALKQALIAMAIILALTGITAVSYYGTGKILDYTRSRDNTLIQLPQRKLNFAFNPYKVYDGTTGLTVGSDKKFSKEQMEAIGNILGVGSRLNPSDVLLSLQVLDFVDREKVIKDITKVMVSLDQGKLPESVQCTTDGTTIKILGTNWVKCE